MTVNYSRALPRDSGDQTMQEYPAPIKALANTTSENATVSSVINLTNDTTAIEIAAQGGAAAMRWVAASETAAVAPAGSVITAAGTSNYDHFIPSGTVRRFVVPRDVFNARGQSSVQGLNVQEGLMRRVAYKTIGVSSVITTEY